MFGFPAGGQQRFERLRRDHEIKLRTRLGAVLDECLGGCGSRNSGQGTNRKQRAHAACNDVRNHRRPHTLPAINYR